MESAMTGQLGQPRAILWDWDGTLVDSFAFLLGAHNSVRAQLGFDPITTETFFGYFGKPRGYLYNEMYGPENFDKARGLFDAYVEAGVADGVLKPLDGAQKTLEAAAALDAPMGVVSNKRAKLLRGESAHFGWCTHFETFVGAGDAKADKPDAAPLLLALDQMGVTRGCDVWLIGDTTIDVGCAKAARCTALFVGAEPPDRTDRAFDDLADLRAFFLAMQAYNG